MPGNIDRIRLEAIEKRRGETEELVKGRKRKLAELYTVSTLSRIRTTAGDASLKNVKDSLLSFLEKNDIQRGQIFDTKTLPPLEFDVQDEKEERPEPATPSVQPTLQQPQSQSLESLKTQISQETVQSQSQPEQAPHTAPIPASSQQKPLSPSTLEASQNKLEELAQSADTSTNSTNGASSIPVAVVHTRTTSEKPDALNTTSSTAPDTRQHTSQLQTRTQTQTLTPSVEDLNPTIKKRRADDRIQLYDPNNKDAVDTMVLVLKSYLPAKVAEVTPLAELYYLAQTLPLAKLMSSTHKVVTSTMYETTLTEGKVNVVHSRIEELKRHGKWSLRQPSRFVDPYKTSTRTHWDNLLSEMNWMAIDFKEERKLRLATCAFIAESIEDYWKYGNVCCVRRKPIKFLQPTVEEAVLSDSSAEAGLASETAMSDCIDVSKLLERPDPSKDIQELNLPQTSLDEYKRIKAEEERPPFKLFIDTNDINPQDKNLLDGIPIFTSFHNFDHLLSDDTSALVPVSKALIQADDDSWYNIHLRQLEDMTPFAPSPQKGLFGFSSQRRVTSAIKPPPPPSLKYLNLRTPTIWLPEDDQNLIEYVNMFSFNWGVVSAHLSKRPTRSYQSNIERRTPWQCFERYIQLNDTFQIQDMRGQNYVSSMKWLEHAHHIQATTKRRISPLGVGPDSIQRGHKRLRWGSMFEAVRKCMRKRESQARVNPTQARKNVDEKTLSAPTPAELSKLKYDRDKAIQDAHLQNTANQRRAGPPTAPRTQPQTNSSATNAAVAAPGAATQQRADSNKRPNSVPAQALPKIGTNIGPQGAITQLKGPNGQIYTTEQLQQLMQMKQRKMAQQQAAASSQGAPSPSNTNAQLAAQIRSNSNPIPVSQGAGSLAPMSQSGQLNGLKASASGTSLSPSNQVARKTQLAPAQITAVIQQISAQNPNMPAQEVTRIAAQYLANLQKSRPLVATNGVQQNMNAVKSHPGAVNQMRPSQPPTVQKSAPAHTPTPQQILQQQAALAAANSTPRAGISTPQKMMVGSPTVAGQIQPPNLTPQQRAQMEMMRAANVEQQQARRQQSGNDNGGGNGNDNFGGSQ